MLPDALREEVNQCGYFPDFVADSVALALDGESVADHLVHLEATFAGEELHRHLTVLVLTPSRLVVNHTDEGHDGTGDSNQAVTTSESIALPAITSVALSRVVAHPERFDARQPDVVETWLTVGWGTLRRIDIEPATCGDPECDADHGFSGSMVGDDLTMRMSPTADGPGSVERLAQFTTALQHATGRSRMAGGAGNGVR